MTAEVVVDVVEQILVRLDVKDLIRCKSVCKSWHSLISGDCFIKYHLNHSYNNDINNFAIGHRRIITPSSSTLLHEISMIGSSNGLVCVSPQFDGQLLVANPWTREVKRLQQLPELPALDIRGEFCWGFGYDSSTNDYKVIVGFGKVKTTCFYVLSLKTNIWKFIRHVNYEPSSVMGVLLDGSIHWFMMNNNNNSKKVILSFDLSREDFIEISIPDECDQDDRLGIIKECLCVYSQSPYTVKPVMKWVLKKYDVKKFWKPVPNDYGIKCDVIHNLKLEDHMSTPNKKISIHSGVRHLSITGNYIGAPIYVQSLVSPHVR